MVQRRIVILSLCILLVILGVYAAQGVYVTHAGQGEQTEKEEVEQQKLVEAKSRVDTEKQQLQNEQTLKQKLRDGSYEDENLKVVFLTFDDGPDEGSNQVLDVLKENGVQATFFTNGRTGDEADQIYRRIVNEGHTLANHTWSHEYSLYKNPEAFYQDVDRVTEQQRKVTGIEPLKIFRFPGGSNNSNQTCVDGIASRGFNFIDWNVENGDGMSNSVTPEQSYQRIVDGCHGQSVSVVLTHAERPVKAGSRESLDRIIKTLKSEGYIFLPIDESYKLPQFMTASNVSQ